MRQVKWLGLNGGKERHADYMERRVGNTFKGDEQWFNNTLALMLKGDDNEDTTSQRISA